MIDVKNLAVTYGLTTDVAKAIIEDVTAALQPVETPSPASSDAMREALDDGPQLVVTERRTCTGCKHLRTEWWKDYLENDETDSGTTARCAAVPDEHGGKCITNYWSNGNEPPKWCPRATLAGDPS